MKKEPQTRRSKGQVRKGKGVMCNLCGKNCGKGGALKKHVEATHRIKYEVYKEVFYGKQGGNLKTIIADAWDDSVKTADGKTVITHVLVRRFVGDPGPRGASRSPGAGNNV